MNKEYTIFSKWLAYELRVQGFRMIRTDVNKNYPQYDVWVFENSTDLQLAIRCLTTNRQK